MGDLLLLTHAKGVRVFGNKLLDNGSLFVFNAYLQLERAVTRTWVSHATTKSYYNLTFEVTSSTSAEITRFQSFPRVMTNSSVCQTEFSCWQVVLRCRLFYLTLNPAYESAISDIKYY